MLPLSGDVSVRRPAALALTLLWAALYACSEADSQPVPAAPAAPETAWVEIGDQLFELELALDAASRYRGLSGRRHIPPDGGMLFVFPSSRPLTFVMRDCQVPIDVAFLDESGRIVAVHEMEIEAPRRPDESASEYNRRLHGYSSGVPARFAIEVAGGRLAQVGAQVGQTPVFDADRWKEAAR